MRTRSVRNLSAVNIILRVVVMALGLIAVFMTFRAKYIIEKFLHKEATDDLVLRVKYVALALAVISFITIFLLNR